jgi:hypothetical protein
LHLRKDNWGGVALRREERDSGERTMGVALTGSRSKDLEQPL